MEYYLTSKENANVESHSQISVAEHPAGRGGEPLKQAVLDPEHWKQIIEEWQKAHDAAQLQRSNNYQPVCPSCGRCPHCGRGGYWGYPYQPFYQPSIYSTGLGYMSGKSF